MSWCPVQFSNTYVLLQAHIVSPPKPHPTAHSANAKKYNFETKDIKQKTKTPVTAITAQETQQPQPEAEADKPHNNWAGTYTPLAARYRLQQRFAYAGAA